MSKKLVAILIVVMLLGFTFKANAQLPYYNVGMSPSITTGNTPCKVAGYLTGGIAGVYVSVQTLNPVAGTLVGKATEAITGKACDEIIDWASDSDADQQAKKLDGGYVYFKGQKYVSPREWEERSGYGTVTGVDTWVNYIYIKDKDNDKTYEVRYGWYDDGVHYVKAYMLVDKDAVQD